MTLYHNGTFFSAHVNRLMEALNSLFYPTAGMLITVHFDHY